MADDNRQENPWDASFQENSNNQYSRTQNRRKSQRVSLVVGVLVVAVIALSFVPVYKYLQALNRPSETTGISTLSTTSETTTSKASVSKAKSSSEKAASAKSASEAKASSEAAAKSSSEAAQSSSEAASSSSAAAEDTAQFESGTLYSFARANNTTTDNLYALNPGLTAENYASYYGQALKIK